MCIQINSLFTCGHRSFRRFDNCPRFGKACYGAGSNHQDEVVATICTDCRFRQKTSQKHGQEGFTPTPDGGTPDSNGGGGGSSGGGGTSDGSASEGRKDPWWDGDPWRRYRKE